MRARWIFYGAGLLAIAAGIQAENIALIFIGIGILVPLVFLAIAEAPE